MRAQQVGENKRSSSNLWIRDVTDSRAGVVRRRHKLSLKLSVAVLTLSEPSLTNTIAVLLSHEVCKAMIHTHRCGLDRDSRAKLAALFIQIITGIQTARTERYRCLLLTSVAAL